MLPQKNLKWQNNFHIATKKMLPPLAQKADFLSFIFKWKFFNAIKMQAFKSQMLNQPFIC